ncbi:branched-chain amino acid ABC transporter permease [Siminovitchia terrae]|uniref:Branched-chain amino acid ABC transporter permease n=1 Tax=Siminovitchia terrae TaxID=1914933 RepID=A0A429XAW3_SIMTE|nr:branched-chain amino acid ABC transporter permease [Siminovitchia terrae]RST60564.1 branched-chain amino acid ABC transporter permease [Siminovitchia terrae]GIN93920.1 branched-chain amino acid ABC transporter permease [Siminovitchia terrae]GIN98405.1 branched-chain amino acid ABC transporter permease [Siminovitchia terrae]
MKNIETMLYGSRWRELLVFLGIVFLSPIFISSQYLFTLFILIGIYSIITVGLSLLIGYTGQISIGHAAFFGIGAYISGVLTTKYEMSAWGAMLIGMVVTFCLAYIIGIPVLKLKGHILALATIAINVIVYILLLGLSEYTGGAGGLVGIPNLSLFGIDLGNQLYFYYFLWGIAFLVILFSMNIIRSSIGRLLRSIHDSEIGTETLGINAAKYKVMIFSISAAYASLAGSLYAHYINFIAPPTFYITFSILLLVMVMVGGVHSIWGAIIGTTAIMFLNEFIRFIAHNYLNVSGEVEIVFYGLIIILVMIFMPKGLVGVFERLRSNVLIKNRMKKSVTSEKGV